MTDAAIRVPVVMRPGNPLPRSPGVTGEVIMRFVVDTLGRPEPRSIGILKAAAPAIHDAVLEVLPRYAFTPAVTQARCKVRQLVYLPFAFKAQ